MELEKTDIPSGFSDANDCKSHLREIEGLRTDMGKILESEAFESLEGKQKIQQLLNEGSQASVNQALNHLIDSKISEYQTTKDPEKQEGGMLQLGDTIQLHFQPTT